MESERWLRSHGCAELTTAHAGSEVVLGGWVHRRRDHGGIIFIDLRDRSGLVQLVFNPAVNPGAHGVAVCLRGEYVVGARGLVTLRPAEMINPGLPTGAIELYPEAITIHNPAKTPPIYIEPDSQVDEAVRLRYRYVDLRRPDMQWRLAMRHRVVKAIRDYLDEHAFLEIETPQLTRSTPEGARDFLVPSRVYPGRFFALPQSPQLFKQLLMVGGLERYFQIARCFRDEDQRGDRQPEFTQLDLEMSFTSEATLFALLEGMFDHVYRTALGTGVRTPFTRLPWAEAMRRYGTDKPDLRFSMGLVDVSAAAAAGGFRVMQATVAGGGGVFGLVAPGCAGWSRKEIDGLVDRARELGAQGLAWLAVGEGEVRSPIAKFYTAAQLQDLLEALEARPGDLCLLAAGQGYAPCKVLGALRCELGEKLGLAQGPDAFVWVTEFPLFERDEAEGRLNPAHHPFTAPHPEDEGLIEADPLRVRSRAFDLVLNGVELCSGSIRIHRRELQERVFSAIGLPPDEARAKFGFLLEAFEYGTPPHGGVGFGLDRIVMLMARVDTIREVIAFPKTTTANCLLTGAPAVVDPKQLEELELKTGGRA
ncbi:MAG: aspartate--tRNA ligase [Bacillota bacterium]